MKNKLPISSEGLSVFALAIILLTLFLALSTIPPQDQKGMARVQKILGKEVYVLCEPLQDYEVVERLTTALTSSLVGRSTIQKQMQEVIDRAMKRKEKGKISDFDAAYTDDGDVIILIKFKE